MLSFDVARVNSYIFMDSWEANIFAEVEPNPYQHLEQYEERCWLQQMQIASSNYLNNTLLGHGLTLHPEPQLEDVQASTLEFEPFEVESTAHQPGQGPQGSAEDQPEISFMPFELDQHSQMTASNLNNEGLDSEWQPSESAPRPAIQPQTKQTKPKISFNTTDYIVKHCFKKMLSPAFRSEVEEICERNSLTYSDFCLYWKKKFQKYLPTKHLGLTKFRKLIEATQSTAVIVCRVFITQYLWRDYPRYVTIGGMRNKQEYLRCATKLMYISRLPKGAIQYPAHKQ